MLLPLTCILCAILLAAAVTHLPATACKDSSKKSEVAADAQAVVTVKAEVASLSICESKDAELSSGLDAVKSTLRAGRTVGKAMVTTAVVLASSMARAARHAAAALLTTAHSLV